MNTQDKRGVALWRLAILGPLTSARLEHGDRQAYFEQAAERAYEHPDGRRVRISPRTIEGWFYQHKQHGFEGLFPDNRSDRGRSRAIAPEVADLLIRAKRERPRRSIRRLIRMLERARKVREGELKRSSVHRLLKAKNLSSQPPRGPAGERRSFMPEHAGDLWMGDVMHGPKVITTDGKLRKSYLITQIDAATRFVAHSYFALSESAVEHEYGLKQAFLKHGRPRLYYVDRGAAYMATSLRLITAELGVALVHTQPRDCQAKGAIERWHRRWREEVQDELPDHALTLDGLNSRHWAWLGTEYHRVHHTTTGRCPLEHWLAEAAHLRRLPAGKDLDEVFLHRANRKVRKDATVRFAGRFLEVRPELTDQVVELRFAPRSPFDPLPKVFIDERFVCDTVILDPIKNCTRKRRRGLGSGDPNVDPSGLDPLELIEQERYQRTIFDLIDKDNDDKE